MPKFRPEPSYPLEPQNPRSIRLENDLIRVRHFRLQAGFRGDHFRRAAAVVIQLAPAHIRFTYPDGRVEEVRMNAGDTRFEAGGSYVIENLGDRLDLLRIDLKTSKPEGGQK